MGKVNEGDKTAETDAQVVTFHQVRSLIPDSQELLTIGPSTRVVDALKMMQKHHYSQLPVVVGKAVLGIFSYRSFSEKALTRQKAIKGEWLGDQPVEDFLEEYEFVHGSQDWNRIVDYLNRDDAFFVGHPNGLDGLVTTMDVLDYFRDIASPFIILAEIELSLRRVIQISVTEANWRTALESSLTTAYEGKVVPMDLGDMTFDNYVQIISNNGNWKFFETFFDSGDVSRKQTARKLQQLRDWRNIVFHFKRRLEPWELDTLGEHRAWLQRRMRAYEAHLDTLLRRKVSPQQGSMNRGRFMAESSPTEVEFYSWLFEAVEKRAVDYGISWHKKSFSIRLRSGQRPLSFAYGYIHDRFEIYFEYLRLPKSELADLRRALLAFGVFTESGKHSLKVDVSQVNGDRLREACRFLLDRLVTWPS